MIMEDLFNYAKKLGIVIEYLTLNYPLLAFCWLNPKLSPHIVFSKYLDHYTRDFKCIFAEEIGCVVTAPVKSDNVNTIYYRDSLRICWAEDRALSWGADFLITDKIFYDAARQCKTIHDFCEYLDVTEPFVQAKMKNIEKGAI